MRQLPFLFLCLFGLLSCNQISSSLSSEEASTAIKEYYTNSGCFNKLDTRKIERLSSMGRQNIEIAMDSLEKEGSYKAISWKLESINGIMNSDDGKSATVDFTLGSEKTILFLYQKYQNCGDEQSDFGPWDMVAEFVKYDTGWQIKSKPKGR